MKQQGLIGYSNPSESLNLLTLFSGDKSRAHTIIDEKKKVFYPLSRILIKRGREAEVSDFLHAIQRESLLEDLISRGGENRYAVALSREIESSSLPPVSRGTPFSFLHCRHEVVSRRGGRLILSNINMRGAKKPVDVGSLAKYPEEGALSSPGVRRVSHASGGFERGGKSR